MHEKVLWVLKKAGNEDNFEEYDIINKRTKGMVWKEKHCYIYKKNFEHKYSNDKNR